MYRGPMDASLRADQLKSVKSYLDFLEHLLSDPKAPGADTPAADGPFCAGSKPSLGDLVAYPTFVFIDYMLPKKFGWKDVFETRPGLARWWDAMNHWEPASRVGDEVTEALISWDNDGRWERVGIEEQVKTSTNLQWSFD
uniref:GST C-terminal domain-containing protein n=2 Tax=Amorphochlora amoebiformis TaxID=1561963 RepID=A0A7S0D2X8_9EUKA|mmetsp:Transcript_18411/g.29342  ORF Transcript_18411/g.29342 Transcript_18411/m.29342 type:complete len:140 (+) Transcript_18411:16-435(+)